jgi:motility quorum-sensing regulator / GCU-specific mRNA interferase toxin
VRAGAFQITNRARFDAAELGFDEEAITRCVLTLTGAEFYKTMPSKMVSGLWQDVYRPVFEGEALYVKLQIAHAGGSVVISFKGR